MLTLRSLTAKELLNNASAIANKKLVIFDLNITARTDLSSVFRVFVENLGSRHPSDQMHPMQADIQPEANVFITGAICTDEQGE
jgi:hypothetical protein